MQCQSKQASNEPASGQAVQLERKRKKRFLFFSGASDRKGKPKPSPERPIPHTPTPVYIKCQKKNWRILFVVLNKIYLTSKIQTLAIMNSSPFRYSLKKEDYTSASCVYKLWFGKKFFIWKAKALFQSLDTVSVDIDRRLRNGMKQGDMYTLVISHIQRARVTQMEAEVVLYSDNPEELLIAEYEALKAAKGNPDCLNMGFYPYIPKWIPEAAVKALEQYIRKKQLAAKSRPRKKGGTKRRSTRTSATAAKKNKQPNKKTRLNAKARNNKAVSKRRSG